MIKTLEGSALHTFKRGEIIIRQGEPVNYIYYLTDGTCYRSAITEQGEEYFYWIRSSGNVIGSLLDGRKIVILNQKEHERIADGKQVKYYLPR